MSGTNPTPTPKPTSEQPTSRYQRFMGWCEQHKYPMMAIHYAFIAISSALVSGMAFLVAIQRRQEAGVTYTAPSIWFTGIYAGLSTIAWIIATLLCASKTLNRANKKWWNWLGVRQKARFWFWFLGINTTSLVCWSVITTLFWDVTWVCWMGKGEGAELNPFQENLCDQLANLWFYAIFLVLALAMNMWLVVDEQLTVQFKIGEDVEDVAMRTMARRTGSMEYLTEE
ncbi:hypothetical protein BC830DRAFT_1117796 [Chytriomyces sp. MP71]|nr:hypothetical protein BC830DRAFT_1117796 [Chytriomyces sp. MP71]